MRRLGVGYRPGLAAWLSTRPSRVGYLEIVAEHFFHGGHARLRALGREYALLVHGLGLSLGTPGPLDRETLDRFAEVVAIAQPRWISEHVAFTRAGDLDLGHLTPLRWTRETLRILADHAREVAERCRTPLLLENIATHLQVDGEMTEPDFLNRLCDEAGCGLLLDVTNLFVNSRNHGFDPHAWLREIDPGRIGQLHVVGYTHRGGRWLDLHAESIQEDVLDLTRAVLARAPVPAIIVERDVNLVELTPELEKLEGALGGA